MHTQKANTSINWGKIKESRITKKMNPLRYPPFFCCWDIADGVDVASTDISKDRVKIKIVAIINNFATFIIPTYQFKNILQVFKF